MTKARNVGSLTEIIFRAVGIYNNSEARIRILEKLIENFHFYSPSAQQYIFLGCAKRAISKSLSREYSIDSIIIREVQHEKLGIKNNRST